MGLARIWFRFSVFALLPLVILVHSQPARLAGANIISDSASLAAGIEGGLIDAINSARAEQSLPILAADGRLAEVARLRSQDMATRHYFAHISPDGRTFFDLLDANAIPWRAAGENLAECKGLDPVPFAIDAFMKSPGHRQNVLSDSFNHVGVGFATADDGTVILTVIFAN